MDHPSIIKFHEFIDEMRNMHQITELAVGQNFATFVKEQRSLSNKNISDIFEQIAHAICEIHKKNIVHRDIKAENVVIDKSDLTVKLVDFGFAIRLDVPGDGKLFKD